MNGLKIQSNLNDRLRIYREGELEEGGQKAQTSRRKISKYLG